MPTSGLKGPGSRMLICAPYRAVKLCLVLFVHYRPNSGGDGGGGAGGVKRPSSRDELDTSGRLQFLTPSNRA